MGLTSLIGRVTQRVVRWSGKHMLVFVALRWSALRPTAGR